MPTGTASGAPDAAPTTATARIAPPMPVTLEEIVARTRVEVARASAAIPIETVQSRVAEADPPRSFFAAVVNRDRSDSTSVIAEVKERSPSAGVLRAPYDPVAIATAYENAGAAAISCLTDEHHFGGHLDHLQLLRSAVRLPILRKDFLVDAYQVWEARAVGADAILLIAEVLPMDELVELATLARHLDMTTLVEVHDLGNLLAVQEHLDFNGASTLLGINNRNLTDMTVDMDHAIRMVGAVEDPDMVVAESGIEGSDDLARLRSHGIRIALVGTALLRADDPGEALRALLE